MDKRYEVYALAGGHFYDTPDRLPGADGTPAPQFATACRDVPEGWRPARSGDWLTLTPLGADGAPLPSPAQGTADEEQLHRTLRELGALLEGFEGPYILTDLRWYDGPTSATAPSPAGTSSTSAARWSRRWPMAWAGCRTGGTRPSRCPSG
jgi:hypothetical protein